MNLNTSSPYETLNQLLGELHQLALSSNWEATAALAKKIDASIQAGSLGIATVADRLVIEQSLKHLEACLHKAEPNRDDIALLLKGFGVDLRHD